MEYYGHVCKSFRNSVIKFTKSEWAVMTRLQREEIFEHFSVVVRGNSDTHEISWKSEEIQDFYDFFVERQAHGKYHPCLYCFYYFYSIVILYRGDKTVVILI